MSQTLQKGAEPNFTRDILHKLSTQLIFFYKEEKDGSRLVGYRNTKKCQSCECLHYNVMAYYIFFITLSYI